MRIPVLVAVTDAGRESALVAAFERGDHGVTVVRRCVDVADLLATAATGVARAAVVSGDLRRLDREGLARLTTYGVAVVALVADEPAEMRLRQLGVRHVLPAAAPPATVGAAVVNALTATSLPVDEPGPIPDDDEPAGRVVAVWGPTGAPGRTTYAVTLATELARLGVAALLVDADTYGGTVAPALGIVDEAPGLAAAVRLANNGLLDVPGLARVARSLDDGLRVLTGISRADRWPEIRPAGVEAVLGLCRRLAEVTVVDTAFAVEKDDTRRNAATITTLADADTVVAIGSADPLSLQRLVRALTDLGNVTPRAPDVVVNRVRKGVVPGDPEREITEALSRYASVAPAAFLPYDRAATDAALMHGRSLADVAPKSKLRLAIRGEAERMKEGMRAPRPATKGAERN